jgi:lysyl-tRNA synthetase class 2
MTVAPMPDEKAQSDFRPSASLAVLCERSALLRKLHEFFWARGFVEVETPLVAAEVIPELHIDPLRVGDCPLFSPQGNAPQSSDEREKGTVPFRDGHFLQASPELHMKRLLAAGAESMFQVTRSFRGGERGRWHNGEFTIVEWYQRGGMRAGIDLVDELTQEMLATPPTARTTYADAFRRHVGVDPHDATVDELAAAAKAAAVAVPSGLDGRNRDEWLNLLLALRVEPQLGRDRPEVMYHYPATQASLATTITADDGTRLAERFELYYRGIELANGFHELTDAAELRRRFEAVNRARIADRRGELPMPDRFLAAMEHGLPDSTGCALGFDRLVMLATGAKSIDEVIAFPTERA